MKWLIALLVLFAVECRSDHQVANDIWKAFRAVSNDSALLSHIIPEMYGSSMSNANPTFVFKMPAGELLTMQRSDFAEPIFPNITTKPNMIVDVLQAPPLDNTKTHVKSSLSEWQELGLEGWTGELKPPEPQLEQSHRDIIVKNEPDWRLPDYPHDQIILDLKSQRLDGRIKDIRVITSNSVEAQQEDLMNGENVYIARANDPFGYSMKWSLNNDTDPAKERGKRDVAKLYSMIKCSTNCDPLIYKGYGCYCGFGGHGVPNDGIDRCCRLHDKCYGQSNCISYLEYFVPYVWKCYRGKPLCAIDHGEWGGPDSCAARLCQCDLRLSRCLRNFYCPNRRAVCFSSRTRRLQNFIYY